MADNCVYVVQTRLTAEGADSDPWREYPQVFKTLLEAIECKDGFDRFASGQDDPRENPFYATLAMFRREVRSANLNLKLHTRVVKRTFTDEVMDEASALELS